MTLWTAETVATALGISSGATQSFSGVMTDTRTLMPDSLFVALVGQRFDGHAFLNAACDGGATGAVVQSGQTPVAGLTLFEVEDTLTAYGMLARYRRRMMDGPVVAITGTNGKTSTKEMVLGLMRTRWKTHGTRLNNNNRVGVALTILEAPDDTEALVVEAGANELGEISLLRDIIEPTVAVITNVAAGHLDGFDSVAGVLDEKTTLLRGLSNAVVGEYPPELRGRASKLCPCVLVAGMSPQADVRPEDWELDSQGCGRFTYMGEDVQLSVAGKHQISNALLALGAARLMHLNGNFANAFSKVTLPGGRCEVMQHGSLTIVNDTYNANPASLHAALQLAQTLRASRKLVIVVGSMLELGEESDSLHREAAVTIVEMEPHIIGAIGDFAEVLGSIDVQPPNRLITANHVEDLGRALRRRLGGGELVLLKASRGVGLERIIPILVAN